MIIIKPWQIPSSVPRRSVLQRRATGASTLERVLQVPSKFLQPQLWENLPYWINTKIAEQFSNYLLYSWEGRLPI